VNIEKNFEPEFITIRGRGKVLKELKQEAKKSKDVYLAADSDREGEAISYHIKNAIEKDNPKADIKRIVFNEITEKAIKEAIKNPRDIDENLVNAQKARRVLDRIVGYTLSPLLWEKIKKGLSAGRVQSVALKVICEREEEIEKFVPEEYWTIDALFSKEGKNFSARLAQLNGKRANIKTREEAEDLVSRLKDEDFIVSSVVESTKKRRALPPFTTSKLQQAAGNRLGFPSRKTMMIAQQLYEGISIGGKAVGLITYMRTDSVRVSSQAQEEAKSFISEFYGNDYIPEKDRVYSNKKGSQDAHEAIRPTLVYRTPESLKSYLTRDQYRLYRLIWERFVASQMRDALVKQMKVEIKAGDALFRVTGQVLLFDGFLKVAGIPENEEDKKLPHLNKGEKLIPIDIVKEQHHTEPPPRFTDATLVKFLEESGIGRPSTYAPIITTLINRYYIERKNKQFRPTFLGKLTNDLLKQHFSELLDINFTSQMEEKLDQIAEGKLEWAKLLKDFYKPFMDIVGKAQKELASYKGITDEETDYICDKCGSRMVKKLGKYGYFLACSAFPDCRNTMPLPYGKCPVKGCDGYIVERKTKRRRSFYGCTNYPDCDFMIWEKPASKACPKCGTIMLEKKIDGEKYLVCLNEECGYKEPLEKKKKEALVT
ncbi:MAG TPA: type I DNA topoisomerase, partial [Methanomicrobia archaeon]|nr:type I DNA topoisomerase [Methanomicrobia archaeon]